MSKLESTINQMFKYIKSCQVGFEHPAKIWNLCEGCDRQFATCQANRIFMCDLVEVPPPDNDAVILCDSFKEAVQ